MYGYEASVEDTERLRSDIDAVAQLLPQYSIPAGERGLWAETIDRFAAYTRGRRWSLSDGASLAFSNIVAEEIHAATVGRAESPLRSHIIGLLTRSVGAFQPTVSLLKRMGATVISEAWALPHWLAIKLKAYEEAKEDYVRNVISTDREVQQWMRPALMFIFLLALGMPPLTAGVPAALTETTLLVADGGRLPRATLKETLYRVRHQQGK